jgi:hypothetical protein
MKLADIESTEEPTNTKNTGGKVTAESLLAQADADVAKGPREAFKAWAANKKRELVEVERRVILIQNEIKQGASDFNKGLWVPPAKSNEKASG